jgi:hypothetical protein
LGEFQVQIKAVDVFDPNSGEVRNSCWYKELYRASGRKIYKGIGLTGF